MQTHSVQVPNLFASAKAVAAIQNRKCKRGAAPAVAAARTDAEQVSMLQNFFSSSLLLRPNELEGSCLETLSSQMLPS